MKSPIRPLTCLLALAGGLCFYASAQDTTEKPVPTAFTTMDAYKGKPFEDSDYKRGAQKLPGVLMCAYFDQGGEGVGYHDLTPKNLGSGELNKGKDYLSQFRVSEAVDTSFTKYHDPDADNSPYNNNLPAEHMLYVGWTDPGEWLNYTVDIKEAGTYAVDFMHTGAKGGALSLDIDGKEVTTFNVRCMWKADETVQWRHWHHWNYEAHTTEVTLPKGTHVLTIHIAKGGNMNLGYLVFYPKPAGSSPKPVSDADAAPQG